MMNDLDWATAYERALALASSSRIRTRQDVELLALETPGSRISLGPSPYRPAESLLLIRLIRSRRDFRITEPVPTR